MVNVAVCDDNKAYLDKLTKMIEVKLGDCGISYKMFSYLSGKVFMEHHKKDPFDVVFLDILMPDVNGFDVAKEIRGISEKTHNICRYI